MSFENAPNFIRFQGKNILAIDYGKKVTGLGFFTPGREPFPQPYDRIVYKNDEQLIDDLLTHIDNEFFEVIVLGLPHLLDGGETDMTRMIKKFGELLKTKLPTGIELYYQDETLTTREAQNRMKSSPRYNFRIDPAQIDALSASIILEDFIKSDIESSST